MGILGCCLWALLFLAHLSRALVTIGKVRVFDYFELKPKSPMVKFTCSYKCALYFATRENTPREYLRQIIFNDNTVRDVTMEEIVDKYLYNETGFLSPYFLYSNSKYSLTNNNPQASVNHPFYVFIFDDLDVPAISVYHALYASTASANSGAVSILSAEDCITLHNFVISEGGTALVCAGGSDCKEDLQGIAVVERRNSASSVIKVLAPLVSVRFSKNLPQLVNVDGKQGLKGMINADGLAVATSPGYAGNSDFRFNHYLRDLHVNVTFTASSDLSLDIAMHSYDTGTGRLASVSVSRTSGEMSLEEDISGTASQAYKSVLGSEARLEWKPATASAFAHGNILVSFRVSSGTGGASKSSTFCTILYIIVTILLIK